MKIAIGSDHGGYALKMQLIPVIEKLGHSVQDFGCALCTDETMARLTREHNDSNMLALGGRIIGVEVAKSIVSTWLTTEFSKGSRHIGRISKIEKYEA